MHNLSSCVRILATDGMQYARFDCIRCVCESESLERVWVPGCGYGASGDFPKVEFRLLSTP